MRLEINSLKKTFGEKVAIDIDHFQVENGQLLGLVGNNGAGKTTLFRCILDLLLPDNGQVTLIRKTDGGETSFVTSQCEEWKNYTGAFVDTGFLIDYLTPEEYFAFIGKVCQIAKDELAERLKVFTRFMNNEVVGQKKLIRNLSAGNQQKVGIIGAMLSHPELLILDEPFNFLDPSSQIVIKRLLAQYCKRTGATVLISSHNLNHTIDICTRMALLENGHIIKDYDKSDPNMVSEINAYFQGEEEAPDVTENINDAEPAPDDDSTGSSETSDASDHH